MHYMLVWRWSSPKVSRKHGIVIELAVKPSTRGYQNSDSNSGLKRVIDFLNSLPSPFQRASTTLKDGRYFWNATE